MRQYSVPALEKAMAILDLLAQADRTLSVSEIHMTLELPKATAFTVLNVLERYQMVKKDERGRYTLGVKLYELGTSYVSKIDLVQIAHPHLQRLMQQTSLTAHLGVIYDRRMMFIDKVEPQTFVRFSTAPGMRADLHISSLGKAMAAYLPEEELTAIISARGLGAYTGNTVTTLPDFKRELENVRHLGYAIEDEEGELGVRCVGAPIFDRWGKITAAVSVTGLVAQIPEASFERLGRTVQATAGEISKELGFPGAMANGHRHPGCLAKAVVEEITPT